MTVQLEWENLVDVEPGKHTGTANLQRVSVPGGWLVRPVMNQHGLPLFVPDPDHGWGKAPVG